MKQSLINVGEQYVIDPQVFEHDYVAFRGTAKRLDRDDALVAIVREVGVEREFSGRRDGAVIEFVGQAQAEWSEYMADRGVTSTPVVGTRYIVKSVAQVEAEEAARIADQARKNEAERQKLQQVAALVDQESLGQTIHSLYFRTGTPAIDLVGSLDALISRATEVRDEVAAQVEGDRWEAKPTRDEDGVQRLHSVRNDIVHLGHSYAKVTESFAAYEGQSALVNALTNAGIDFDAVGQILYPKDPDA